MTFKGMKTPFSVGDIVIDGHGIIRNIISINSPHEYDEVKQPIEAISINGTNLTRQYTQEGWFYDTEDGQKINNIRHITPLEKEML